MKIDATIKMNLTVKNYLYLEFAKSNLCRTKKKTRLAFELQTNFNPTKKIMIKVIFDKTLSFQSLLVSNLVFEHV